MKEYKLYSKQADISTSEGDTLLKGDILAPTEENTLL